MSDRQIMLEYVGSNYRTDVLSGSFNYNRFEYKFDFKNVSTENFVGKEEDLVIHSKKYSRLFGNINTFGGAGGGVSFEHTINNLRIPDNLTNKTVVTLIDDEKQRIFRNILSGDDGFYLITMRIFSTNLSDVNDFQGDLLRKEWGNANLESEVKFYSRIRPPKQILATHSFCDYPGYEFEITSGEEIIGENFTVITSNFKGIRREGYITTFTWKRFNSIDDVIEINDFPLGRNALLSGNPTSRVWLETLKSSGILIGLEQLKFNKHLELFNHPFSSDTSLHSDNAYEMHLQSPVNTTSYFRWAIYGPFRNFWFHEYDDARATYIIDTSSTSTPKMRNIWSLNIQDVGGDRNIILLENMFKIDNPDAFHSAWVANSHMDWGVPTHLRLNFSILASQLLSNSGYLAGFYYLLDETWAQNYERLTGKKCLLIKRNQNRIADNSLPFPQRRLPPWGQTYIPSTTLSVEISAGLNLPNPIIEESDPHIIKLDDFTYIFNHEIYIPIWNTLTEFEEGFKSVQQHPLGIKSAPVDSSFPGVDEIEISTLDIYGREIQEITITKFKDVSVQQSNNSFTTRRIFEYPQNEEEGVFTAARMSVSSAEITNARTAIAPRILTPYMNFCAISQGSFFSRGFLKQHPLRAGVNAWYLSSDIPELLLLAKSDWAEAFPNIGFPGLDEDHFEKLEEELNEILDKLNDDYEINPNPHRFRVILNSGFDANIANTRTLTSRPEVFLPDDVSNRTRMYCNPELYSKFDLDDLLFLNYFIRDRLIAPLEDEGVWELNVFTDPDPLVPDIWELEFWDGSTQEWEVFESDPGWEIWEPFWINLEDSSILDSRHPTNHYGRMTETITSYENNMVGIGVRQTFCDPHFLENGDQEYVEIYFNARDFKNIEGNRHCSRKSIEDDADLKFPQPESETPEQQEERLKAKEKWKLEEAKKRAIIEKQMENFS